MSDVPDPADGLPDLLERLKKSEDGFSERETARLNNAFKRFKVPGSADLHMDDLVDLLEYLGHVMTAKPGVVKILREVTSYDYIDFDEFLDFMQRYIAFEQEQFHDMFKKFD